MSRNTERRRRKNAPQKVISKAQELKQESDKYFNEHHKHNVTRQSYPDKLSLHIVMQLMSISNLCSFILNSFPKVHFRLKVKSTITKQTA